MNTDWIYQLTAGAALIVAFLIMLRFLLGKFSQSLDHLSQALSEMEKAMENRDQIILNHLEHFQQTELEMARLLKKLCEAWEINNGRKP